MLKRGSEMEPWYKVVTPRPEVRKGRSFDPDDFAIHMEQVVAGKAPADYQKPDQFFSRTVFTPALKENAGMILRRLSGETENAPPVIALVTQFGGGKTHTLTFLYHITTNTTTSSKDTRVNKLLKTSGLKDIPKTKVAVFVGNAWDPQPGKENPWIDIARQLAGDKGVDALGQKAKTTPPGTDALSRLYDIAGGSVLILMDEVLNFFNRHRDMGEQFFAFIDNVVRSMTGTTHSAAVVSLPRSQVEMTNFDREWQERITKVVRRVAKELIVTHESEIAEVLRSRLFEDLGSEKTRATVAKAYAEWCFERRAQLPSEWTSVDSTVTDSKAKEVLRKRFEDCYPFHPATLSVFQRKWQTLQQYQQTRGTLAMFAQWISWTYKQGFQQTRDEPLITLGSAPLQDSGFQATILGQLGEPRLKDAIECDIAGENSHAHALDVDTKGVLEEIHRRVGTVVLFESSGGMVDKVAHLPELRFELGEPGLDTTSIDNAVVALERKGYYIRKVGTDGYRFGSKPSLKKKAADLKASLDEDEVKRVEKETIKKEFERGATLSIQFFPEEPDSVPDSPKLTLIVIDPETTFNEKCVSKIATWTSEHGSSPRLYPGALIWCVKKPGSDLREKTEWYLSWKRVSEEISQGLLGVDFEENELRDVKRNLTTAGEDVKDEIWAGYRFVLLYNPENPKKPKQIDLGAGHASTGQSLAGRVLSALTSEGILNDSVGAGYIERNWPPALKETGIWSLQGLRQAFMNGTLTRLPDADKVLKEQIPKFIERGEFGFGSGQRSDGTFERLWFKEPLQQEEITFDAQTHLIRRQKVEILSKQKNKEYGETGKAEAEKTKEGAQKTIGQPPTTPYETTSVIRLNVHGEIPPELWNRLGTKLLPKLRTGKNLKTYLNAVFDVSSTDREWLEQEIQKILTELNIKDWTVTIEKESQDNK